MTGLSSDNKYAQEFLCCPLSYRGGTLFRPLPRTLGLSWLPVADIRHLRHHAADADIRFTVATAAISYHYGYRPVFRRCGRVRTGI